VGGSDAAAITVVVVTWEGANLLPACLDAIMTQTLGPDLVDVLVVDNASTDATAEVLRRYPAVRVVTSRRNLGFAGGVALAQRQVATPYAALVNNDAELAPDALERMLAVVDGPGGERVGAVTARVLLAERFAPAPGAGPDQSGVVTASDGSTFRPAVDGRVDLLNSTGNVVRTDGFGQDRDWLAVDDGSRASGHVFGFTGAAALLRVAAIADAGGIDDRFFMYYEDTDLSWRMRLAGWEVRYEAGAVVRHQHSRSSREGSTLFRFHDDRNRLLTLTKDASRGLALRAVARYPLTAVSVVTRSDHRGADAGVRAKVLASYLRMLPGTLRRRREIGRLAAVRGITRRQVEALLVPVPSRPTGAYRRS